MLSLKDVIFALTTNKCYMKRVLFILLCILTLSVLDSCSGKKNVVPVGVTDINVSLDFDDSTQLPSISDLFDVRAVQLETGGLESIVGQISDIRQMGDTLFLQSSTNIMMFNANDGRFIRKIERVGRGRGEYISINGFDLDEAKQQIVLSTANNEIFRYNMDGSFVSKADVGFNYLQFALLPNGNYVFFTPFDHNDPCGFWLTDGEFNFKRQLVPLNFHTNAYMGGRCMIHINDSVLGIMGFDDTGLFYHMKGDSLIPVYRMVCDDFGRFETDEMSPGMSVPSYYKSQYIESDGLLAFSVQPRADYQKMVRVCYDKKNTSTTYLHYMNNRDDIDREDVTMPGFSGTYKGRFYQELLYAYIQYDEIKKSRYPSLAEESNPIIRIFSPKK